MNKKIFFILIVLLFSQIHFVICQEETSDQETSKFEIILTPKSTTVEGISTSYGYKVEPNKNILTFIDDGTQSDEKNLQIEGMGISDTKQGSKVSYNPEEKILSLDEKSTADVSVGDTNLEGITDATIKLDENGEIEYAEFVSKEGGEYTFYYNGKPLTASTGPGGTIIFNPKEKKLSGLSETEEIKFDFGEGNSINAKNFDLSLDESGEVKDVVLEGGVYHDAKNNLDYSSSGGFSVFYDGRNVENFEGNAVSINTEDTFIINSKGIVSIRDNDRNIIYRGESDNVYLEYDREGSDFNVYNGDASITNGDYEISVSDGIKWTQKGDEKNPSSFSVRYFGDGKTAESIFLNYNEEGKLSGAYYGRDERRIPFGDAGNEEAKLAKSVENNAKKNSEKEIQNRISELDSEISAEKDTGKRAELIQEKNVLELKDTEKFVSDLVSQGDYDSAIEILDSYLEIERDPQSQAKAKMSLATLYQQRFWDSEDSNTEDLTRAGEIYEQLSQDETISNVARSNARLAIATMYLDNGGSALTSGDSHRALIELNRALKQNPDNKIVLQLKNGIDRGYFDIIAEEVASDRKQETQEFYSFLDEQSKFYNIRPIGYYDRQMANTMITAFGGTPIEGEAEYKSMISEEKIRRLDDEHKGIILLKDLVTNKGMSLEEASKLSAGDLAEIYHLPTDYELYDSNTIKSASEASAEMQLAIEEASKNYNVKNLVSGAYSPFTFEDESLKIIKEEQTNVEKIATFLDESVQMVVNPNVKDVALFLPAAKIGKYGTVAEIAMGTGPLFEREAVSVTAKEISNQLEATQIVQELNKNPGIDEIAKTSEAVRKDLPGFYHGSSSASLDPILLGENPGLKSSGTILREGSAPYSGELGEGVTEEGVNLKSISAVKRDYAYNAVVYSKREFNSGWSPEIGEKNIADFEKEIFRLKNGGSMQQYTRVDGLPTEESMREYVVEAYESRLEVEKRRLAEWGSLTFRQQIMIKNPFPVVYGFDYAGEFSYEGSMIAGEVGIPKTILPEELTIFVPSSRVEGYRNLFNEKGIKVKGVESLDNLVPEGVYDGVDVIVNAVVNQLFLGILIRCKIFFIIVIL